MRKFSRRLLFFSAFIWRQSLVFHFSHYFKDGIKPIYSRSSVIPHIFLHTRVAIHSGKKWTRRFCWRWRIGFKFGEFTWNRRIAIYKAKQLRKKNSSKLLN